MGENQVGGLAGLTFHEHFQQSLHNSMNSRQTLMATHSPPRCYGDVPNIFPQEMRPVPMYQTLDELCWGVTQNPQSSDPRDTANFWCGCMDSTFSVIHEPKLFCKLGTMAHLAAPSYFYYQDELSQWQVYLRQAVASVCESSCFCESELEPKPIELGVDIPTLDVWRRRRFRQWDNARRIAATPGGWEAANGFEHAQGGRAAPATRKCTAKCSSYRDCDVVRKKEACSHGSAIVCSTEKRKEGKFSAVGLCIAAASWTFGQNDKKLPKRSLQKPLACPCNATYISNSCCIAKDGLVWEEKEMKLGELG